MSDKEKEHLDRIMMRMSVLYDLDNLNPLLVDVLNDIAVDVEWLCDKLRLAWTVVEAYQNEIRRIYYNE